MDFDFSFEQQMIAKSVRSLLQDLPPVLDPAPFPYSATDLSSRFAELGLFAENPADPVLGFADAVAVAIEVGRALPAGPAVEQLAASFFVPEAVRSGMAVTGRLSREGDRLAGRALVPFAADEATVLIPVTDGDRSAWQVFAAEDLVLADAETTDITVTASWASPRPNANGRPLAAGSQQVSPEDILQLLAMAEMTGSAESALERTIAYIAERKQFGKPIGTNQAVKHIAADAASDVEIMKAAVEYAGWALDDAQSGDPAAREEARTALLTARSFIGDHARLVLERCVQMHGGIAFTWDYGLHRYLRRILYRTNTITRPMESREALAGFLLENA